MILNGKAKELFIQWKNKEYETELYCAFSSMPKSSQNALIIEWLDTLGHIGDDTITQMLIDSLIAFRSVSEATTEANKRANSIINKE